MGAAAEPAESARKIRLDVYVGGRFTNVYSKLEVGHDRSHGPAHVILQADIGGTKREGARFYRRNR